MLINEREDKIRKDINKFLAMKEMKGIQLKLLSSLINGLKEITRRLFFRITQLQDMHPIVGKTFIIDNTVIRAIILELCG